MKDKAAIGMITVGQSPRTDVAEDIKRILGLRVEIAECGALDGLSLNEVRRLEPSAGDRVLVTRMQDGTEVKIGRNRILDRMRKCIAELEASSKILVILCTDEFPELRSKRLLVRPSDLVRGVVESLLPCGSLGVLIPSSDQVQETASRWKRDGVSLRIEVLSPYQEQETRAVTAIAESFGVASVDMIVLDCIGYSYQTSELIKNLTNTPVILPRAVVAKILKEII